PQLLISQRSAANVPQLHADEAAQVAGRDVLELEDPEQVLVHLDEHALLQTGCLYGRHVSLAYRMAMLDLPHGLCALGSNPRSAGHSAAPGPVRARPVRLDSSDRRLRN